MSGGAISPRTAAPVAAFDHSVRPGDWAAFADRFAPGATTRFAGGPAGPFNGREAIAAGYAAQPPTGTLTVSPAVGGGDAGELWLGRDGI